MTLILLPGLDGTDIFFRPLLAALPPWIEAHCVEYPVSGPNDYRDLLPLVRNACQACEEFFLLGWSFSGPLALMLAAESPAALRGVVLCASFISPPWPTNAAAAADVIVDFMRQGTPGRRFDAASPGA